MTWKPILNNKKKQIKEFYVAKQELIVPSNNPMLYSDNIIDENCLHCGLFSVCSDQNKGFDYICSNFKREKIQNRSFNFQNINFNGFNLPKSINKNNEYSDLVGLEIDNDNELELLLSKIMNQFSTGQLRDLQLDDSDLPEAKNYVDFWYNPRFVGTGEITYPFPKQVEMAINYLSEWCPKCSNPSYVKCIPTDATIEAMLEQIQLLEHGVCPKCKQNRIELWSNPEYKYKRYTSMIGIAGQRGGKTAGINRINGYMYHRYFKLNKPTRAFNVEDNVWLETCFTATEFKKAADNFYDPLVHTFQTNKWFKEYHEFLDYHGQKRGQELYKILGQTAFYNHRNYLIYPKSPDPANMRGATRICSEIDELAHLWAAKGDDAKKLNPAEVYNVLSNQLFSCRLGYTRAIKKGVYNMPPPIMCNITSPRSVGDYAMKLYRMSQDKESTTYGWHYNVYEMNPYVKDDPELEQIKRERPEDFKRDFMAIPPSAHNAFIEDKGVIIGAVRNYPNAIELKQGPIKGHHKSIKLMSADFEIRKSGKIDLKKTHKILALDAGTRFNSFAFCIAHLEATKHPGGWDEIKRVYDVIGEIIPENDRVISIPDIYNDVLNPLIDEFNVIHISADRWNSQNTLITASNDYGIEWKQYSCKMKDFVEFRTGLISGEIKIPKPEMKLSEAFDLSAYNYPICFKGKPIAHFMVQTLTVENYIKTVEKGGKYTDDMFRAAVLANHFLVDENLQEELLAPVNPIINSDTFIGAYANSSGSIVGLGGTAISSAGRSQSQGGAEIVSGIGALSSLSGFGR